MRLSFRKGVKDDDESDELAYGMGPRLVPAERYQDAEDVGWIPDYSYRCRYGRLVSRYDCPRPYLPW